MCAIAKAEARVRATFPGRHANMLSGLTTGVVRELLLEQEVAVLALRVPSGAVLGDSQRVAVVSRHSPPEVRVALRTHIATLGTDYQRMRTFVTF